MTNVGDDGLGEGGTTNSVGIGAEPDGLRGLMINHMPDRSPSTFDISDTADFLAFCIESHETVGVYSGFHKPNPVFIVDGHAVGPCVFASRYPPFFHL